MTIQVNSKLTKSRNPLEHEITLHNSKGEVVQQLDDGYNLVRFLQFRIKKQIKESRKVKWIFVPLEWYVHSDDLHVISM